MTNFKLQGRSLYELQNGNWMHVALVPVSIKTLANAVDWYLYA